jgi:hypothetical protein
VSVQERYCSRGERCKLYDPETAKPQKLGIYHEDEVCDQCRKSESEAAFETYRHARPLKYEHVKEKKNPLKRRLRILKRNLVARMLAKRGGYWEAITEVRNRWHLDPVPTQLPPASEDILYPPSVLPQRPPRPMQYILPPDTPNPYIGEPGGLEEYENWLNLRADWLFDLGNVLRCGVPERYIDEEALPYMGWPPPQERWLHWYRFAAACVLYNPPPEEASVFADYGGLPLLPGKETKDEPTPSVLTEQHLREGTIDLRVQNALEKMISEKAWELRSELGDLDFHQARRQVWNRFQVEFEAALNQLRQEWYQREIELDPACYYYVKFDPLETTDKEVLNAIKTIRAKEGYTSEGGREPNDELLPVTCALLLGEPEWSAEQLANQLGLSIKRVQGLARDGQKFLQRDG